MKKAPQVGPTLVHVVRHGEVDNPRGVLYGRLPGFHLSGNGHAMAERLGEYFSGVPLDRLVSSPLTRAQETMAPIAAGQGSRRRARRPGDRGQQQVRGQGIRP